MRVPEAPLNNVLQAEYARAAAQTDALSALNGKRVLITGATGLIGAQLVNTILAYNRERGGDARVTACARDPDKIDRLYGRFSGDTHIETVCADVTRPLSIASDIDYIIHLASVTASADFVARPVDTIRTLMYGTDNLLALAREKKVKRFVYASSLEVYGAPPKFEVAEPDIGYIDILSARSSYSEGKRMAECLCAAYWAQYGVPAVTARLTQTIGAGVEYNDARVFAQFARCVIERKDIQLKTSGATVRSYLDIIDAARALFTLLTRGEPGEAYNVANMDSAISIADYARLMCALNPEAGIKVVFEHAADISALGYNPETRISLDTRKINALGWRAEIKFEDTLRRLVKGMRERRGE